MNEQMENEIERLHEKWSTGNGTVKDVLREMAAGQHSDLSAEVERLTKLVREAKNIFQNKILRLLLDDLTGAEADIRDSAKTWLALEGGNTDGETN